MIPLDRFPDIRTNDQLFDMTKSIAEYFGWTSVHRTTSGVILGTPPPYSAEGGRNYGPFDRYAPGQLFGPLNYATHLDAMAEAEKEIDRLEIQAVRDGVGCQLYNDYVKNLRDVVGGVAGSFSHITASAPRRAEAWLITFGRLK